MSSLNINNKFSLSMFKGLRCSDPIISEGLRSLRAGEALAEQTALQVAGFLLGTCICDNVEISTEEVCRGVGYSGDTAEVIDLASRWFGQTDSERKALKQKEEEKAAKKLAKEEEEIALNSIPEQTETPMLSETDEGRSIEQLYLDKYSFEKRLKTVKWGNSDSKLAEMAYVCIGQNNFRRISNNGQWMVWNKSHWEIEEASSKVQVALGHLGDVLENDLKNLRLHNAADPNWAPSTLMHRNGTTDIRIAGKQLIHEIKVMTMMVNRLQSGSGQEVLTKMMGNLLTVKLDQLDNNEDYIAFNNKYWSAKRNTFTSPSRIALGTRSTGFDWQEPTAEATEKWNEYLHSLEFDEETLEFLKRSFGYTSLGRGTMKRFWWFRGETNTSKSTTVDLVKGCLGSYAAVCPSSVWIKKTGGQPGHTDELAALRGVRFVHSDEFPKNAKFDDALIKQVNAGGNASIRASHKGEKGFPFKIRFGLMCTSNYDPYIADDDDASLDRLTTVTFTKKIAQDQRRDAFVEEFLRQPFMRNAIMKWVMEGARAYIEHGLGKIPESVERSKVDFKENQTSVSDQIEQLVERGPTTTKNALRKSQLEEALRSLQSRTNRYASVTTRQLNKVIFDKFGVNPERSNGDQRYDGLRLKADASNKNIIKKQIIKELREEGILPPEHDTHDAF